MRTFGMFLVAGALAFAMGCGGSSDSSNNNGTPSTGRSAATAGQCPKTNNGQPCPGVDAYYTCMKNACGSQLATCFGSGYASGSYSGPCAAFISCQLACPCDATAKTCEQGCLANASAECTTCVTGLGLCIFGSGCQEPSCTGTTTSSATSTSTSTSLSATCAAAAACCSSLATQGGAAAALAQSCKNALVGATDDICSRALASYQQTNFCK